MCAPQSRQENQRVDRHPLPQNLRPPPLRHHLNLQSVRSREARGVPSYYGGLRYLQRRCRRDGYLGGARTASSVSTLLFVSAAAPVASFSEMFILGIYSATDICPAKSRQVHQGVAR
jgi:hypothetical protein